MNTWTCCALSALLITFTTTAAQAKETEVLGKVAFNGDGHLVLRECQPDGLVRELRLEPKKVALRVLRRYEGYFAKVRGTVKLEPPNDILESDGSIVVSKFLSPSVNPVRVEGRVRFSLPKARTSRALTLTTRVGKQTRTLQVMGPAADVIRATLPRNEERRVLLLGGYVLDAKGEVVGFVARAVQGKLDDRRTYQDEKLALAARPFWAHSKSAWVVKLTPRAAAIRIEGKYVYVKREGMEIGSSTAPSPTSRLKQGICGCLD